MTSPPGNSTRYRPGSWNMTVVTVGSSPPAKFKTWNLTEPEAPIACCTSAKAAPAPCGDVEFSMRIPVPSMIARTAAAGIKRFIVCFLLGKGARDRPCDSVPRFKQSTSALG